MFKLVRKFKEQIEDVAMLWKDSLFACFKSWFFFLNFCVCVSDVLNMMSIVSVKQVLWTEGESWLVDVFDWDEIIVNGSTAAQLSFGLDLCTESYPCYAHIIGKNGGLISRLDNGFISCIASNGCTGLVLETVQIACTDSGMNSTGAVLQVFGSDITIMNSTVSACSCIDGAIQASDGTKALINFTRFENIYNSVLKIRQSNLVVVHSSFSNPELVQTSPSDGRRTFPLVSSLIPGCKSGTNCGIIQAYDGSKVEVSFTTFTNHYTSVLRTKASTLMVMNSTFTACSSESDGGAIQIYDYSHLQINLAIFQGTHSYSNGGAISVHNSNLSMESTAFFDTSSDISGGALWIANQDTYGMSQTSDLSITIKSSSFQRCTSKRGAGAILSNMQAMVNRGYQVDITKCKFAECRSDTYGGAIIATGRISVNESSFTNCNTLASGGAIAAINCNISVTRSLFQSCTSNEGGGAIFAAIKTGTESLAVSILVVSSVALDCSAKVSGGAIQAGQLPITSGSGNSMTIKLLDMEFSRCSSVHGGTISLFGSAVSATIQDSIFMHSYASFTGGAISVFMFAELAVYSSIFYGNAALDRGGGVFHFDNAKILMYNLSCNENQAPSGGGGVLFWQNNVFPSTSYSCPTGTYQDTESCLIKADAINLSTSTACPTADAASTSKMILCAQNADFSKPKYACSWSTCKPDQVMTNKFCGVNNKAMYGPCVASDFKNLLVPKSTELVYLGQTFTLYAIKKDAYNQTIESDSVSTVNMIPNNAVDNSPAGNSPSTFRRGIATFPSTAINPVFERINLLNGLTILKNPPSVLFYIVDLQGQIPGQALPNVFASMPISVAIRQGTEVCPLGSILVLDKGLSGFGECLRCQTGTYSVNPLGNGANSSEVKPSCLICPTGNDALMS